MAEDPEVIRVEGGMAGERGEPRPLSNRADAAFAELGALRAEAAELGLTGYEAEPLAELRQRVEQARAAGG